MLDEIVLRQRYVWGKHTNYKDFIRYGVANESVLAICNWIEQSFETLVNKHKVDNCKFTPLCLYYILDGKLVNVIYVIPSMDSIGRKFPLVFAYTLISTISINWTLILKTVDRLRHISNELFIDGDFERQVLFGIKINDIKLFNIKEIDLKNRHSLDIDIGFDDIQQLELKLSVDRDIFPLIVFVNQKTTRLSYESLTYQNFCDFFISRE